MASSPAPPRAAVSRIRASSVGRSGRPVSESRRGSSSSSVAGRSCETSRKSSTVPCSSSASANAICTGGPERGVRNVCSREGPPAPGSSASSKSRITRSTGCPIACSTDHPVSRSAARFIQRTQRCGSHSTRATPNSSSARSASRSGVLRIPLECSPRCLLRDDSGTGARLPARRRDRVGRARVAAAGLFLRHLRVGSASRLVVSRRDHCCECPLPVVRVCRTRVGSVAEARPMGAGDRETSHFSREQLASIS